MGKLLMLVTLVILGLLTPGAILLDGTARGLATGGLLRLDLRGRRRLALAFVPYGPGQRRVYWRLAVGAMA